MGDSNKIYEYALNHFGDKINALSSCFIGHLLIFGQFVENHICRLLDASKFLVGDFEESAFFHHTIWRVAIRTDVDLFAQLDYFLPQGFLA